LDDVAIAGNDQASRNITVDCRIAPAVPASSLFVSSTIGHR
jgi:hypothetical protein